MKRVIELLEHGAGFTAESLPDNKKRFSIICEEGTVDVNKLNACLLFLEAKAEPETLLGLQSMMFQVWDNEYIDFTTEQKRGLETIFQLLARLWACERRAKESKSTVDHLQAVRMNI